MINVSSISIMIQFWTKYQYQYHDTIYKYHTQHCRVVALRTSRSQLLRGLPGFCRQRGSGVVSASNSTDAWRASCTGVPSGRRLTCPKPSIVDDRTCTSGRLVFAATHESITKSTSAYLIPRRVCGAGTAGVKLIVFCHQLWEWSLCQLREGTVGHRMYTYILRFVWRLEPDRFHADSS